MEIEFYPFRVILRKVFNMKKTGRMQMHKERKV